MSALITDSAMPQPITNATLPAGLITPEFDIAALTVDELREEMRRRGYPSTGAKTALVDRLQELINNGKTPAHRLTTNVAKRKRPHTRKEPTRDEFSSDAEFRDAWEKWRVARDNNNLSVKRSREAQRRKKEQHETICKQREAENARLEKELAQMRMKMSFLVRAVSQPQTMTEADQQQLRFMLLEEAAKQASMAEGMGMPNPAPLPDGVTVTMPSQASMPAVTSLSSLTPVSMPVTSATPMPTTAAIPMSTAPVSMTPLTAVSTYNLTSLAQASEKMQPVSQ
eukprot:TRINITY_DN8382_c0_g1_i1.p1 TRINITY_DN8382_c0_g1~~TRINITY_DN8382_c0_g1_i1.p1  ORF type:complete len:283 (+),score=55.09 TRINITY_DN8382_c0_g1_i1:220-1068(+)